MKSEMQELIEAAQEMLKCAYIEGSGWDIGIRLKNAIAAALASEGGWIDCKDRLPDYGGKYLAVLRGFTDAKIIWWSMEHKFWSHMSNETPLDITFWMPVPSPPLSVETPEVSK